MGGGGCVSINRESHPETVVQESVDDRVDEAVRHGEPMNAVVKRDDECLVKLGFVVEQLRVEVDDDYEGRARAASKLRTTSPRSPAS